MRSYTWDEYYTKFYDWAESTQARYLSNLTSLGPADQVAKVISELQTNISASNRLLRRAVKAKLAFSSSDIIDFSYANDKELIAAAVKNSAARFTAEDMKQLYLDAEVEDELIIEICQQQNLALPKEMMEEEDDEEEEDDPLKKYTWDEYYDKFYDWDESTQVYKLDYLTSLGPADEVGEIIYELRTNLSASNALLRRAVEEKLVFSSSDLTEFSCINDKKLVTKAVKNSAKELTAQDMEDLYLFGEIEDKLIIKICKKQKIALPEQMVKDYEEENVSPPKGPGFLTALISAIASADKGGGPKKQRHNGHCDGDCAHCPPHYGYRYGRWYYGHDHTWGCEFGGNKGSGGM